MGLSHTPERGLKKLWRKHLNKLNATQQGIQQAHQQGDGHFFSKEGFRFTGTLLASTQYQTLEAQRRFVKAWDNEWNTLATAQMSAIRINK